jgi:Domain of unknown function (DUF5076)
VTPPSRELIVPAEVSADEKATEVLRAWVANEGLICSLRPTQWKDSSAWGIVLADVARHVANAFHEASGDDPAATVARIRKLFNDELRDPTDEPTGGFVG